VSAGFRAVAGGPSALPVRAGGGCKADPAKAPRQGTRGAGPVKIKQEGRLGEADPPRGSLANLGEALGKARLLGKGGLLGYARVNRRLLFDRPAASASPAVLAVRPELLRSRLSLPRTLPPGQPVQYARCCDELATAVPLAPQLVATALAEEISALTVAEYLEERAQRGSRRKFDRALNKVRDTAQAEDRLAADD
jgi:hypothetical protein